MIDVIERLKRLHKLIFLICALTIWLSCKSDISENASVDGKDGSSNSPIECPSKRKPTVFDDFFNHKDFEKRLEKSGQVSSILEELGNSREKLLKSGDFIELFPTLYFHTTKGEFDKVLENKSDYPIIKLDMIVKFYDAYKMNRKLFDKGGVGAVEPHWKNYYQKVLEAKEKASEDKGLDTATEILLDGIDAHVNYDIPRFVRDFAVKSSNKQQLLKKEFDEIDSVFQKASERAHDDVLKGLNISGSESHQNIYKLGATYIIYGRKKSWEVGVSDRPLLTKNPQPSFKHNSDSRAFFPKELLTNGICRKIK